MDTKQERLGPRRRRRHSDEFRAKVVAECSTPGVSVASVALANGLNANLLRNWIIASKKSTPPASLSANPGFVPVALAPAPSPASEIAIEVRRGETTVQVRWPIEAAAECGAWLRTWLR
jgi:transposase